MINPGLINSVHADPREPVDDLKEKLKHLRRFYRFMRDDQGMQHPNIIREMIALFPSQVDNLIELAGYIESKIVFLPHNQIPRWVTVQLEAIYSLVHHALTKTGDQRSAIRLLTAYLWYQFSQGKEITPPGDVIDSSGLSERSFKTDLKAAFGVEIKHIRRKVIFGSSFRTSWKIRWNEFLPIGGITFEDVQSETSRIKVQPPKPIPKSLEDEFVLHQLYYPQQPIQLVDGDLPIIHSDGNYATIPLVEGIVPILISFLVPTSALHNWLKQGGTPIPSKRIKTLYKLADKRVNNLVGTVKYIRPSSIQFKLAPRIYVADFMRVQYRMMRKGLLIDELVLHSIDPPRNPTKSQKKNRDRIKALNKLKQNVLRSVSHTGGWLRGTYNLESHSERIYYRKNNIQSFPKCFKRAVVSPEGYTLVYLDVMANDLSILFNLSQDTNGLGLLQCCEDPYAYLAAIAFPGENIGTARKKVKEVVSPWIYGAGETTIIKGDKLINRVGVQAVKRAISSEFPRCENWIKELSREVRNLSQIPARFNPLDNKVIPMPKAFNRRVAPSMIIQRMGSSIMRRAAIWLEEHSNAARNIMLTVHDSILIATQEGSESQAVVEVIQSIKTGIQGTPGIEYLVLNTGGGLNWHQAEQSTIPILCR